MLIPLPSVVVEGQAQVLASEDRPMPPTAPMAYIWWLLIVYMFYVMAIVCDDYLVPTVDVMCERFQIPEDVAGATLMAFACNGPELLTNACAIFITHSAVGMGTIVGSAIFNVMVIVGACPIVAKGGVLDIPMSTFFRDCFFSAVSIVILAWALPVINLLKASVLLGMAFVYAIVVAKFRTWFGEPSTEDLSSLEEKINQRNDEGTSEPVRQVNKMCRRASENLASVRPRAGIMDGNPVHTKLHRRLSLQLDNKVGGRHISAVDAYTVGPDHRKELWGESHVPTGLNLDAKMSVLDKVGSWLVFLLTVPITFIMYWTVPDVKVESKKRFFTTAFIMSMAWLSATAFVVCMGSDQINKYWGIPQSFLGLTLTAIGTSFPNLFASMITARTGRGPIAVSNALGSNVQNVFLVLALPIWIRVLQKGSYTMGGSDISSSIIWMGITLAITVVSVMANNFKLTARTGYIFCLIYVIYVVQATIASTG